MTTTKGCFGDSHLMLVDVAHHVVGDGSFGNFTEIFVGVAIDDATHSAWCVFAGRVVQESAVHTIRVGTISEIASPFLEAFLPTSKLVQADAAKAKRATKSSSIRFISVDFDDSDRVREREIAK